MPQNRTPNSLKDPRLYEELRKDGASKQKAARISNAAARDGRIDAFFEANQEFHKRIQELSGNRWLLSVIQDLRKVLKLSRLHSLSLEGRLQQSLDEHRLIMAALDGGDAAKAEKLMHDHLLSGREALAKIETSSPKTND